MKKLILILALALPMLAGAETTPKFGYINTQELFALMPELKAAQARMDSLSKQYEDMIMGMREEYNKKEAEYTQKSATMTEAMRKIQEEELYTMGQRIQTAYQTAQQDIQTKQAEFLKPVQERMVKAIEAVGAREGFTYIFDSAATIYAAPSATNVMESVKKELGIK